MLKNKEREMGSITIAHGSGGKLMHELIRDLFFRYMKNEVLEKTEDSAVIDIKCKRIAFTTDSFVVKPVFFPGGDIGKLAVCGTVNDIAVSGAAAKYITCGFIIEEGFSLEELERIVSSMGEWAKKSGVKIVAGDTKVVEKSEADGIFINTSGIGVFEGNASFGIGRIKVGDKVILSGTIADHGIAILSRREGLGFESPITSDCAPLGGMIKALVKKFGDNIRFMRDPTRGGLATTLNEITMNNDFGILVEEDRVPIREEVKAACELLGMDPFYIANEGKIILISEKKSAEKIVKEMRKNKYGKEAAIIGDVVGDNKGKVCVRTRYGVKRIVDMMTGEHLPRIC